MKWHRLSYRDRIGIMPAIFTTLVATFIFTLMVAVPGAQGSTEGGDQETDVFGPENLMKTLKTPFTMAMPGEAGEWSQPKGSISLSPIAISRGPDTRSLLQERFHGPKLYLPARMVLGQPAEFIVKGSPGSYVAIAMADSNKGAKLICGHKLRLGADRKLVAVGKISDQGMISLFVETPIQGDLVGSPLYFEAVTWSQPDFIDLQLASTISVAEDGKDENGVIISGQPDEKKERSVTLDYSTPMSTKNIGTLSSGKP